MAFYLYIMTGPLKGSKILLRDKLTLGREAANVNLKDPDISKVHAQILQDPSGGWHIKDMGSRNGIFYKGERRKRLVLEEGMSIYIGNNCFILKEGQGKPRRKYKTPTPPTWKKKLLEFCRKMAPEVKNQSSTVFPFDPPLSLKILQGIQAETQWYMGYGPRKVGVSSLDFRLFEGGLPDYSFEIYPTKGGAIFSTQHSRIVHLNGCATSSERIKDGDIVSINETQIQINFLRGHGL